MTALILILLFIAYAGLGALSYLSSERANKAAHRASVAIAEAASATSAAFAAQAAANAATNELRRVTALLLAEVDAAKRRSHARVIGEVPPLPPLAGVSLKKMALGDPFGVITSEAPIIGYGEVVEMVRKRYAT